MIRPLKQSSQGSRSKAARRSSASPEALIDKLGLLSDVLVKSLDLERILAEVLACCLDVVGGSAGAAYLAESDGRLSLRAERGYPDSARIPLRQFFAHADLLRGVMEEGEPVAVPSSKVAAARAERLLARAGAKSILILPLVFGKEQLGVLVMASTRRNLADKRTLFTKAVRLQIGQAIALARALSLLAASEQRFRDLVQELDAIVWEADAATWQFSFVSQRAEDILGYPVEQWLTEPDFWASHIQREDRERAVAFCREATAEGRDHQFEYRAVAADGGVVWLRDIVRVVRDDEGRVRQLRGLMVDITERKQAEEALRVSEERYRLLFERNLAAVYHTTLDGHILDCNESFARIFGYASREEVLAQRAWDLYFSAAERETFISRLQEQRALTNFEICCRRRDGSPVWVLENASLLEGEAGTATLIEGTLVDITERKQAEEALRRSEARYRSLIQGALYGIYRSSADGKFLDVNPALVQMLGYESEAELLAVNMATDIYRNPGERARLVEQYRNQDRFEGIEVEWKRKDGTPITVRVSGRPVRDEQGALAYFETITENVTERRALDDQLRQAQKMEAVGRLAGGIAHDFNNLLMLIKGYTELLLDRLGPSDSLRQYGEEIQKTAEGAAALTQQLLAFSRRQVLQPLVLDLNAVVADMAKLLPRLIGEDIELVTKLDPALGQVRADPSQLQQVILNLALNARDAMPQGGNLTIETTNVELDKAYARQHASARPGPYVMLAVSDTGVGMDAETQARIFEPFFTTKERGKGTGLGLATVYGIVKQSDGYIWVYGEPGQGTTFKVYLPRVDMLVEVTGLGKARGAAPRGSEVVLVAEDEDGVRKLTREFLESSGYEVLEAKNGAAAIELAQRHPGPIHLLLTDVVMPGMSGRELAQHLLQLRPDIKVLYVSGYTDAAIVHNGTLEPGVAFLQKPFTRDTLSWKLRETLDARKEQ